MWQNNHVKWVELVNRGYSILDINNNRFQCDYYFIDNINSTSYNRYWEKSWYLQDNENFVREAMYPSLSDDILPDLVPETPYQGENNPVSVDDKRNFILLSGFPNPTNGKFFIQFHLDTDSELIFNVYELSGKKVFSKKELFVKCDIQYMNFEFSTLNSGKYILEIANTNYEILAIKHFIKE
jgi:hypothetical protein